MVLVLLPLTVIYVYITSRYTTTLIPTWKVDNAEVDVENEISARPGQYWPDRFKLGVCFRGVGMIWLHSEIFYCYNVHDGGGDDIL